MRGSRCCCLCCRPQNRCWISSRCARTCTLYPGRYTCVLPPLRQQDSCGGGCGCVNGCVQPSKTPQFLVNSTLIYFRGQGRPYSVPIVPSLGRICLISDHSPEECTHLSMWPALRQCPIPYAHPSAPQRAPFQYKSQHCSHLDPTPHPSYTLMCAGACALHRGGTVQDSRGAEPVRRPCASQHVQRPGQERGHATQPAQRQNPDVVPSALIQRAEQHRAAASPWPASLRCGWDPAHRCRGLPAGHCQPRALNPESIMNRVWMV